MDGDYESEASYEAGTATIEVESFENDFEDRIQEQAETVVAAEDTPPPLEKFEGTMHSVEDVRGGAEMDLSKFQEVFKSTGSPEDSRLSRPDEAREWKYTDENGEVQSLTESIIQSGDAEAIARHMEMLDGLYERGFATVSYRDEFLQKEVVDIAFADAKGHIEYMTLIKDDEETIIDYADNDEDPPLTENTETKQVFIMADAGTELDGIYLEEVDRVNYFSAEAESDIPTLTPEAQPITLAYAQMRTGATRAEASTVGLSTISINHTETAPGASGLQQSQESTNIFVSTFTNEERSTEQPPAIFLSTTFEEAPAEEPQLVFTNPGHSVEVTINKSAPEQRTGIYIVEDSPLVKDPDPEPIISDNLEVPNSNQELGKISGVDIEAVVSVPHLERTATSEISVKVEQQDIRNTNTNEVAAVQQAITLEEVHSTQRQNELVTDSVEEIKTEVTVAEGAVVNIERISKKQESGKETTEDITLAKTEAISLEVGKDEVEEEISKEPGEQTLINKEVIITKPAVEKIQLKQERDKVEQAPQQTKVLEFKPKVERVSTLNQTEAGEERPAITLDQADKPKADDSPASSVRSTINNVRYINNRETLNRNYGINNLGPVKQDDNTEAQTEAIELMQIAA